MSYEELNITTIQAEQIVADRFNIQGVATSYQVNLTLILRLKPRKGQHLF